MSRRTVSIYISHIAIMDTMTIFFTILLQQMYRMLIKQKYPFRTGLFSRLAFIYSFVSSTYTSLFLISTSNGTSFYPFLSMMCLYSYFEIQVIKVKGNILEINENNGMKFCWVYMYCSFFVILRTRSGFTNIISCSPSTAILEFRKLYWRAYKTLSTIVLKETSFS